MKGQITMPEDIGWTIFIMIIVFFVAIITVLLYGRARLMGSGDTFVYSLQFVNLALKPYLVGESLSFLQAGDRQFFEYSLESMVAGAAERASPSKELTDALGNFIEAYRFKSYSIEVRNDSLTVLNLDNIVRRCGEDKEGSMSGGVPSPDDLPDGFCVSGFRGDFATCGIGREKIDDRGSCRFYQTCCKEIDKSEYDTKKITDNGVKTGEIEFVSCGKPGSPDKPGICSKDIWHSEIFGRCAEGREYYPDGDEDCESSNEKTDEEMALTLSTVRSETPFCCVPKDVESLEQGGFVTRAMIPLFFNETKHYKNANSRIEVSIG
ncbi:MAG: hypothetical protein QMD85_03170 [Candidatus Aenigmarchaeota archaeon]|nr:hypothetical protein [Candidatus Aenigmarchaeota archaeon]MDI6722538.1 hypothetical protein [Candidatus Aenigmarchaeota archaeon]